jgi:peroxiredoxin Q/BCP
MTPAFPLSAACLIALCLLLTPAARAAELAVGDPAPAFSLVGSDGKEHALADHLGKRGVVLAWFPKAFTPG